MPLEIKELNIRISVDNQTGGAGASTAVGNQGGSSEPNPALVEACVEKVMEVLKLKTER